MKFATFLLTAALIFPFFASAQESLPPTEPSAPSAPVSNDPALNGLPAENRAQPSTPAAELGETKKPSKKKAKKEKKAAKKNHKKAAKKAKKGKKKKHHTA